MIVNMTYTWMDFKGKTKTNKVHVPLGFTPAQYAEFAIAMGDIMEALSTGAITDIGISIPLDISAATLKSAAVAFADIAKKAYFGLTSATVGLFSKVFLPTWDKAHQVSNSDNIDFDDDDVEALVDIYENGVTVSGTPIQVSDMRGNDIAAVHQGRGIFRKYN